MLIAAWRHVVTVCPDWKLHIWGEGGQRTQLQIQINMLGLEKSCILEGPTDNVVEKYIENSIFVLSSRFEGFAMVIAEPWRVDFLWWLMHVRVVLKISFGKA